jgi:hypothetical protein
MLELLPPTYRMTEQIEIAKEASHKYVGLYVEESKELKLLLPASKKSLCGLGQIRPFPGGWAGQ